MAHDFFGITIHSLGVFLIEIVFFYIAIIMFVFADLWSGIRKAKAAGKYCSSRGLRDTINKLAKYFNVIFMFTMVDMVMVFAVSCLDWGLPHFPFATLLATVGCAFIEIKSVFENMEQKERADIESAAKVIIKIAKDRDIESVLNAISEAAKRQQEKKRSQTMD